jgi:hypothetical protein
MLEPIEKYLEQYFLQNIVQKTELIDEILIAKVDADESFKTEKNLGKIKYLKFGCSTQNLIENITHSVAFGGIQHAYGLHACIDRSKNDLVFLTDPDILFYNNLDKIYLDLLNTYNLNLIGCSHASSIEMASGYYPNQLNMLLRKSNIPDTNFLNSQLENRGYKISDDLELTHYKFPGKWLVPGPIPNYVDLFPNKQGRFETGCNLYILGKQHNWKWLSFQTTDCVSYSTQYRRCNFKPLPSIEKTKLLYHLNNSLCITRELEGLDSNYGIAPSSMNARKRYENFIKEFEKISTT